MAIWDRPIKGPVPIARRSIKNTGERNMLKSLIASLALSALAVIGFAGVAQAHHKVGHCVPGIFSVGCPMTPQTPQLPKQ